MASQEPQISIVGEILVWEYGDGKYTNEDAPDGLGRSRETFKGRNPVERCDVGLWMRSGNGKRLYALCILV